MESLNALRSIIRNTPGNELCVDCCEHNPTWASCNLGVFICLECSGAHRSLGVDISFVKSIGLDKWTPALVHVMRNGGNNRSNAFFEAKLPKDYPRPCNSIDRAKFITDKYKQRRWIPNSLSFDNKSGSLKSTQENNTEDSKPARRKRIPPSERRILQEIRKNQGQESLEDERKQVHYATNERDLIVLNDTVCIDNFYDYSKAREEDRIYPEEKNCPSEIFRNMNIKARNYTTQISKQFVRLDQDPSSSSLIDQLKESEDTLKQENNAIDKVLLLDIEPQLDDLSGQFQESPNAAPLSGKSENGGMSKIDLIKSFQDQESLSSRNSWEISGSSHSSHDYVIDNSDIDVDEIFKEIEQAKINLSVFLNSKYALIETKNRLDDLSKHILKLKKAVKHTQQGASNGFSPCQNQFSAQADTLATNLKDINSLIGQEILNFSF